MKKGILLVCLCLVVVVSCKRSNLNNIDCSKISSGYSANIKPIIDGNCLSSGCHNAGSTNGDFTTYDGLKAKADNGTLDSKVIKNKTMPPSKSLPIGDLKKIKCWLNSSAPNN